jgi:hypothetical protein
VEPRSTGREPKAARLVRKGQFEGQLLLLITLALVAFGLVMVFSATSGQATLGNGDASYYLRKQGLYALVGLVLLVLLRRTSYRSLRPLAPTLLVGSLGLLLAVLAIGTTVNGAKRWLQFGPAVFQPSELAKLALVIWLAAYLARHPAPRTLGELFKPIGLVVGVFCALFLAEPDLGTAITVVVMLGGVLVGRTLRPPPPPPPAPKVERTIILDDVLFDFDRSTVKPEAAKILDRLVVFMQENKNAKVALSGHTDNVGSDAYNQKLSERRVTAVREYVVKKGVDAGRISGQGFGESKPIADNKTREGRSKNRRVEIKVN